MAPTVIKNLTNQPSVNLLARRLGVLLAGRNLTCTVAESCTGGLLGGAITSVSGSSAYFKGGVISYSNELKQRLLGVKKSVLDKKGAVSPESVEAMAAGARRLCRADCAIAVSGVAGPGGGTALKPAGLVYVGIAAGKNVRSYKYLFRGNRQAIRQKAVRAGLERMVEELSSREHLWKNETETLKKVLDI